MSGKAEPTLLNLVEFEALRIETYGITADKRRVIITHVGKRILDVVMNRRECNPKAITQQAYNNVFFWVDELGLRSSDERDAILVALAHYWRSLLSLGDPSPSPAIVWEQTVEGHRIRYARHWHPNRFIVRTSCSLVIEGDKIPKRDGIVIECESRHSVAYELPPNEQPLPRDVVVGELLAQLKHNKKETVQ